MYFMSCWCTLHRPVESHHALALLFPSIVNEGSSNVQVPTTNDMI